MFSYLPITVSIEDVNDNIPEFVNAPYGPIVIDELAPPGTAELCYLSTNYIYPYAYCDSCMMVNIYVII